MYNYKIRKKGVKNMKSMYITIVGTNHYYGDDFLKKDMIVKLKKDPKNIYDKEAIAVKMKPLGTIGYVANSMHTVIGETISAGRLYDHMKKTAKAKIIFKTNKGIIAKVYRKDMK